MKKLFLFGLVISLLTLGCSGESDNIGAGDGDAGSNSDNDAGDYPDESGADDGDEYKDGDPGTDRAADDGGGPVDCQFDSQVDWFIIGEILQMESADQGTCVWLSRTDLCPAGMICKAVPFSLDEVRIGHDGQVREFDSSNATLNWNATWHNWEDSATIDTGTTVFTLSALDYGHAYDITASGGEDWGPIRLDPWEP